MINLLIITLEFPPVNSTGSFRYIKFLGKLKSFGINPIVIAPTIESSLRLWENKKVDPKLESEIKNCDVYRLPLPPSAYIVKRSLGLKEKLDFYLSHTDNAGNLWRPTLIKFISEFLKNNRIDALYVSPPPFSLCKLSAEISKKYNIPLFLDLRDDWLFNKGNPFPTVFHFFAAKKDFSNSIIQASLINVVTPQLKEMILQVFPSLSNSKFKVITNGFDQENIMFQEFSNASVLGKSKIRIGYSGEFYFNPETLENSKTKWWKRKGIRKLNFSPGLSSEDWSYRSPYYFLKVISEYLNRHPEFRSMLLFEHIGNTPQWLYKMVESMGLAENFHSHGFVTKQRNLEIQKEWDAILVTSEKVIDGEHYCISSKVFDAILLHKPIFGFVTEGASKEVLSKSGCSILFNPDNLNENLLLFHDFLNREISFIPDSIFLSRFFPQQIAQELASSILDAANLNKR